MKRKNILVIFWYCMKEQSFPLLFWHQRWLQAAKLTFENRRLRPISAYNVWIVNASEKIQLLRIRIRPRAFPKSYRWSAYVTPNSPNGWLKKQIYLFVNENRLKLNKLYYKFCVKTSSRNVLDETFPYLQMYRPFTRTFSLKMTNPCQQRPISTYFHCKN